MKSIFFITFFALIFPFRCYPQMETDTIRIIADGINQSRAKLSEAIVEVKGEDRGVIFVKVDNVIVSPHFRRAFKYDSLGIIFTREVEMFYFRIGEFIEIDKIDFKNEIIKVKFRSKHHFNKPGPYSGQMIFGKNGEQWSIKSIRLN